MTVRALVGLAVFNLFLLGVGTATLAALRGWRTWHDLVRIGGLAYLLGVALMGVTLSIELVLGIPFSFATIVLTGAALALAAVALRRPLARWRPELPDTRAQGVALVALAGAALVVVYLEALFRSARLSSLSAWDAWAFWVPKAKAIYFFGDLDEQFFRELANPSYPPLVPALEASAFHFMGSADVVTLNVQFWFFACGSPQRSRGCSPRASRPTSSGRASSSCSSRRAWSAATSTRKPTSCSTTSSRWLRSSSRSGSSSESPGCWPRRRSSWPVPS